jgi:DeoR/GlpR family transcriptional regulator of sugar metabolism
MTRLGQITQLLDLHGYQSVEALAAEVGVTQSTIRRDLEQLESRQLIQRTHGGALPSRQPTTALDVARSINLVEKVEIGKAMSQRVLDGQTILLDSGTTTLEVARHLTKARITVVTNDLQIGMLIAKRGTENLVFIGGELLPNDLSMWGPTSVQQLERLRVDVAIVGCDTVMEDGLYSTSSYEIELKRTMLSIAGEAFFVADSSKFGREALYKCFDLNSFSAGITDSHLDPLRASLFPIPIICAPVDRPTRQPSEATAHG